MVTLKELRHHIKTALEIPCAFILALYIFILMNSPENPARKKIGEGGQNGNFYC